MLAFAVERMCLRGGFFCGTLRYLQHLSFTGPCGTCSTFVLRDPAVPVLSLFYGTLRYLVQYPDACRMRPDAMHIYLYLARYAAASATLFAAKRAVVQLVGCTAGGD